MRSLVALLLLPALAVADFGITGPLKVPAGKLADLSVTDVPRGATVLWDVFPEPADVRELGSRLIFVASPGLYTIKARATRGSRVLDSAKVVVEVRGDNPLPPLPPTPPQPLPPVPPSRAWVVVVEETADAVAGRGAYFADKDLFTWIEAKGWKWRAFDKDARDKDGAVPRDIKPYLELAAGKGYPMLFVVDQDGGIRSKGPLPAKAADLLRILKDIAGEKP